MDHIRLLVACILCWISIGCCSAQDSDDAPYARIYPASQKVAEGSHVILTCITSLEAATFEWKKPVRMLNEKRDDVKITQTSGNMSVLEIPRAHVKRHKRTYRCTASSTEPSPQSVVSNDATLKVFPTYRLHSNYPWITAVRQEDKYAFINEYNEGGVRISSELQCMTTYDGEAAKTKSPLTWRWIRNHTSEIKFTEDYLSDRIEMTQDGNLLINSPATRDYEVSYTCVAENSWGTAYSQPIMLNITEVPTPAPAPTCTDRNGEEVHHGEIYMPDGNDPCFQCECFYGRRGRCMTVACQAPTCELYEPSKEKCCDYTCIGDGTKEETNGQCIAFSGEMIDEGDIYQPVSDPCVTCQCLKGEPVRCASVSCIPPPMGCDDMRRVPGKCCEFTCDDVPTDPEPIEEAPMKKVLGHVYVQQVGPRKALVHWKLPSSYDETEDKMRTFRVNLYRDLSNMADARILNVSDRMYAVLDDLDPNTDYYVMVNGTSEMKKSVLMTRTEMFSLKLRSNTALVISDSLGQMYESHGAIRYTGYSLPRQFTPINKQQGLDVVLNLNSFHRVEVSSYNESPCPSQDCGLLRFYSYNMDGEIINHMSLLFMDAKDFLWAKSHL